MSYWKSKVLPKLKKLLHKSPKAQAAEACRSFNKSKDTITKEIEENKEVLQPKVVAIYQSSSNEAKGLLKEPTDSGVLGFLEVVQNLLIELSDAGCPGAQSLSDAATKHGPSAMCKPIVFLLSKLTVFVADEKAPEPPKGEKRAVDLSTKADEVAASVEALAPKSEEPSKAEEPASNSTPVSAA
ncbi:hypothetical protein L7F22_058110 [Adiantum nelumboides]|nr:hypothetical protein [Adiantum nelumboides]